MTLADWQDRVRRDGHVFVPGGVLRSALQNEPDALADWAALESSWETLPLDAYMADRGAYRRRRHAVYAADTDGPLRRQPHQAHYQSLEYNRLNGGVARWFEPIDTALGDGPSLRHILGFCVDFFRPLFVPARPWHIEVHQFRIEASSGMHGLPTPEGMHRDGVDAVLVLLIRRRNIASGTTLIQSPDGCALGSFTLAEPFDAMLIDDHRVCHGVTPVTPLDPALPASRDVLVVSLRRA